MKCVIRSGAEDGWLFEAVVEHHSLEAARAPRVLFRQHSRIETTGADAGRNPQLPVCVLTQDAPMTIHRPLREKPSGGKLAAGGPSPESTIRSSLAPPSNTARAALLARERLLIEKIRFMGETWHRHRLTIELELGDVRRKLERLASPTRLNGARSPDRTRSEFRKDAPPKGAPTPPVSRVPQPETRKKQQPSPRSPTGSSL